MAYFVKLYSLTNEQLEERIVKRLEEIKELHFQEFMAKTYTEKGIIREDIVKLEDAIYNYRWILKERQWELEDKLKLERRIKNI